MAKRKTRKKAKKAKRAKRAHRNLEDVHYFVKESGRKAPTKDAWVSYWKLKQPFVTLIEDDEGRMREASRIPIEKVEDAGNNPAKK